MMTNKELVAQEDLRSQLSSKSQVQQCVPLILVLGRQGGRHPNGLAGQLVQLNW